MSDGAVEEVTELFTRWREGEEKASGQLVPQVYAELRGLAASYLRRERRGHTLQPTELVNEACLRLLGSGAQASDKTYFFALAAQSMRRILVDHARRVRAAKRFDPADRITLDTRVEALSDQEVDVLDLDEALRRFAEIAPRPAQLVELRFFAGLTIPEIVEVLDISEATAARDWRSARIWLRQELQP